MKTKSSKSLSKSVPNPTHGSSFDSFLEAEGILAEVEAVAFKRVIALRLQEILDQKALSKSLMARRMKTSRTSVNRLLDASNPSLTLDTLLKAAASLGHTVRVDLVPLSPSAARRS